MKSTRPLSPWTYVGLTILYNIPVIGLIFLLIHTFSKKNLNRRNYARSFWCWLVIALLSLGLVAGIRYAQGYDVLQEAQDAVSGLPIPGLQPKVSFEEVYEDYAQQLRDKTDVLLDELDNEPGKITDELLEEKIAELTAVSIEGEGKLADVWMESRNATHEEYEEWLQKLSEVYQEEVLKLQEFAEELS